MTVLWCGNAVVVGVDYFVTANMLEIVIQKIAELEILRVWHFCRSNKLLLLTKSENFFLSLNIQMMNCNICL